MKAVITPLKPIHLEPFPLILLFLAIYLATFTPSHAQGTWISQDTDPTTTGIYLTKAGSDCVIHTKTNSRYVYFFDIYAKNWITCDLGKQQTMKAVEAGKHVVFAYSDSLLIAYSSLTSTYQVVAYTGSIISPLGTVSGTRGYGCGENAAYAWTDENYFYVFDGLAGQWMLFYSGAMENASGARNFWCGDNYVAGIFQRYYPDKCRNIAYSLVTKTFNITETGGVYYVESDGIAMTGGFVSTFGGAPEEVLFAGYSAYTNQFYIKDENTPYYQLNMGGYFDYNTWKYFNKRNVYGYTISRGNDLVKEATINTFDTEKAAWFTHSTSFSINVSGGLSNYRIGGSTSICSLSDESGSVIFFIYDGNTGNYQIAQPGIYFNSISYYYNVGNVYATALDAWNHAWFYNTENGYSQLKTFEDSDFTNVDYSSDFITFCQYETALSTMELWFYNSKSDRSSKVEISKDVYPHYELSPYSFVFVPYLSSDQVVFYSSIHDSIVPYTTVLGGINSIYSTLGIFSWIQNIVTNTNSTLLFDAANLKVLDFNTKPVSRGISDSLMLFNNGNIYDVYDASNQTTTTFDLGGSAGTHLNGGDIILLSNSNYSKFYAFQKGRTEWVELTPEGNSLYYSASKNTAVVARFSKVYAFAPGVITGIHNERINCPEKFKLHPNYPNPFSHSTTISYSIPNSSYVSLKIINALGKEISTLFSGESDTGTHTCEWNASGLPNGIYFCRMQAGNHFLTQKLVLLR